MNGLKYRKQSIWEYFCFLRNIWGRVSICFLISLLGVQAKPEDNVCEILSPEGKIKVVLEYEADEGGLLYYRVLNKEREVISKSLLGLGMCYEELTENPREVNPSFKQLAESSKDEVWQTVWGEKKEIRNRYKEYKFQFQELHSGYYSIGLTFRVYEDGVAFRYHIPASPNGKETRIMDELTEFKVSEDMVAWSIPAFKRNRYEYLYTSQKTSELGKVHTPITFEGEDDLHLAIHEAALVDYPVMALERRAGTTLEANLYPWPDEVKVKRKGAFSTPWRVIYVADSAEKLLESDLLLNLNEPCKIKDTSWIKPGKYIGIWWELHLGLSTWGSGERHGATNKNTRKHLDFAAKHGFDGVLVEGWNMGWDGDWPKNGDKFSFTKSYPDFDLEELTKYAREKGTRLIGHHETAGGVLNYEAQLEAAFAQCKKHGINTVKTGYVAHGSPITLADENGKLVEGFSHNSQPMVRHYAKVAEVAARYQVMLDIHEPVKDTGLRRTYPNIMTSEGGRGQEFNAWGADMKEQPASNNPPEHTLILPFTRMLGSPMDFTPGMFDVLYEKERPNNRVSTTLTKQLALYVTLYSPLQMAADLPKNYEARPDAFQFIKDVPSDWSQTRVIHAKIGDYLTTVRQDRHSDDWFLGAMTDEKERKLNAKLDFLTPNKKYIATIYCDKEESKGWKEEPYNYEIITREVTSKTELPLYLVPGGGVAIHFAAE